MKTQLAKYYFQITDIWKSQCELHYKLFDLTCDEYTLLLESDLEKLEEKVAQKALIVSEIEKNEYLRNDILATIKKDYKELEVNSINDLLDFFAKFEAEKEGKHLYRFNALLVDIIEKIQAQNKKNQLFINKALSSLREIRESAMGTKTVSTYNAKGMTQERSLGRNP